MARIRAAGAEMTRDRIVASAISIMEQDGFDAVTFARLARCFGVRPPALYWHVKDRSDLDQSIVDKIYGRVLMSIADTLTGEAFLVALGHSLLGALRRYRGLPCLVAIAPLGTRIEQELFPSAIARVMAGEIPRSQALAKLIEVQSFVLGWATYEANPAIQAAMARQVDLDATFDDALRALAARSVVDKFQQDHLT